MTPYGIDPARIQANRPAAKVRRWAARQLIDALIVGIALVGLLVLINYIEWITS